MSSILQLGRPLQVVGVMAVVVASLIVLTAEPGITAPAATATPSTGLENGQEVLVAASGFGPNAALTILQCKRGATSSAECEGQTADPNAQADSAGSLSDYPFAVYVLPNDLFVGESISCDALNKCDLYVGENPNDFTLPKGFAPIEFSQSAPTTSTSTTSPGATTSTTSPGATTSTTRAGTTITTSPHTATTSTTRPGATTTTTTPGATTSTARSGSAAAAGLSASSGSSGGTTSGGGSGGSGGSTATTGGVNLPAANSGAGNSSSDSGSGSETLSAGSSDDGLAITGGPPVAPWLAGTGVTALVGGTWARRRTLAPPRR